MRTATFLLLLLLLPLTAVAQTPTEPAVTVTIASSETGPSIDAPATYTVTVENTSPSSTTGQDPVMDIALTVSGAPTGWQASLNPASLRLAPGASEDVTLTVSVGPSASMDRATITVTATIYNGLFPPLEMQAEGSDSIELLRQDSTAREITEFIGDYLWVIVGAGILVSLLATTLLVLTLRTPVTITADATNGTAKKGGRTTLPFTVRNTGRTTDVVLHVAADTDGWTATPSKRELHLERKESAELSLSVQAPASAKPGDMAKFTVKAIPGSDRHYAQLVFDVRVE